MFFSGSNSKWNQNWDKASTGCPGKAKNHFITDLTCANSLQIKTKHFDAAKTTKLSMRAIVQFTLVCIVTRPLSGSESGIEFVLIQTSLLFIKIMLFLC